MTVRLVFLSGASRRKRAAARCPNGGPGAVARPAQRLQSEGTFFSLEGPQSRNRGVRYRALHSARVPNGRRVRREREESNMVAVNGRITPGLGAASGNLRAQMPFFTASHPELEDCRCGTINVILECRLEIDSPDFVLGPFKWCETFPPERFGFLKIRFEVVDSNLATDAWVYIPYLSPHRSNPLYAEILAPSLNLEGFPNCRIHVRASKVTV